MILVASRSPAVRVIDDALTREECREIITAARPHLVPGGVHRESEVVVEKSYRDCSVAFLDSGSPAVAPLLRIAERVAGGSPDRAESVQVARYRRGGEYRAHHDALIPLTEKDREAGGQRVWSLLVYLQAPDEGGSTSFPEIGLRFDPIEGRAVCWGNLTRSGEPDFRLSHSGDPVERGEKWVAVLWLRERRIDSARVP